MTWARRIHRWRVPEIKNLYKKEEKERSYSRRLGRINRTGTFGEKRVAVLSQGREDGTLWVKISKATCWTLNIGRGGAARIRPEEVVWRLSGRERRFTIDERKGRQGKKNRPTEILLWRRA